jgi:hypothetical protein
MPITKKVKPKERRPSCAISHAIGTRDSCARSSILDSSTEVGVYISRPIRSDKGATERYGRLLCFTRPFGQLELLHQLVGLVVLAAEFALEGGDHLALTRRHRPAVAISGTG